MDGDVDEEGEVEGGGKGEVGSGKGEVGRGLFFSFLFFSLFVFCFSLSFFLFGPLFPELWRVDSGVKMGREGWRSEYEMLVLAETGIFPFDFLVSSFLFFLSPS